MEVILLIILGVLSRLLPHFANMTAVGGIALFSGSRFGIKKATLVTFITMLLSDTILGFHSLMWATYGSLFIGVVIGRLISKKEFTKHIILGALSSSIVFFLITNFAVWATTPLYSRTVSGFIDCYIMALPFFRNSLMGDIVYTFVFFKLFEPILSMVQVKSILLK